MTSFKKVFKFESMKHQYSFKIYQPFGIRIWHWLNALVILGLLGTVLLRKTFLSWRANAKLIENKVLEAGATIPAEVAEGIAKQMRNQMWEWHNYLGFALGALLVYRLILCFAYKRSPAMVAWKGAQGLSAATDKTKALHHTLVQTGYALFYLATAIMVVTGLTMYFKETLGFSKDFIGLVKETHELMLWFFVTFVALHIVGVFWAERKAESRGIVSDMINGGNKE